MHRETTQASLLQLLSLSDRHTHTAHLAKECCSPTACRKSWVNNRFSDTKGSTLNVSSDSIRNERLMLPVKHGWSSIWQRSRFLGKGSSLAHAHERNTKIGPATLWSDLTDILLVATRLNLFDSQFISILPLKCIVLNIMYPVTEGCVQDSDRGFLITSDCRR